MAGSLIQSNLSMNFDWTFVEELDLSNSFNTGSRSLTASFDSGSEAGQANRVYTVKGTLSASSSTEIDLQNLTDYFSDSLSFDAVRMVWVELTGDTLCSSILVGGAGVANPSSAPTLAEIGGGLGAGTYKVAYTFQNATGETMISPVASITIAGSKDIRVSAITLPSGATNIYYYVSFASTANALVYQGSGTGAAYDITSLPATNGAAVPQSNTTHTSLSTLFGTAADRVRVQNSGVVMFSTPLSVTAYDVTSTNKKIKITNEDSTYNAVYVLGVIGF